MEFSLGPSGPTCDIWKGSNGRSTSLSSYIHLCEILISINIKRCVSKKKIKNTFALSLRCSAPSKQFMYLSIYSFACLFVCFFCSMMKLEVNSCTISEDITHLSPARNSVSKGLSTKPAEEKEEGSRVETAVTLLCHEEEPLITFRCRSGATAQCAEAIQERLRFIAIPRMPTRWQRRTSWVSRLCHHRDRPRRSPV